MNLSLVKFTKKLFKKYSARAKKGLGQHFLIDQKILQKIIRVANLKSEDIILEIGPGIGTLTLELAKKVKKVIAIEKDPKMIEILKELLKNLKNVKIIEGDILKIFNFQFSIFKQIPSSKLQAPKNYKLVANIPYYLTSPLIRKFLEAKNPPKLMVLMVQKEVAERICAKPPDMNLLAVSVQFYSRPEIISFVSKKSFWPSPKVDSAILRIAPLINTDKKLINADLFFRIVRAGFSQPRKQILNNLVTGLKLDKGEVKSWLLKNKIKPTQRAETLTIKDRLKLTKTYQIFN